MEVIVISADEFQKMVLDAVRLIKQQYDIKEDRWVSPDEAMKKLRITSKTTLQKLRDEGKIRFSQPEKKIILYDTQSINKYLETHANETF